MNIGVKFGNGNNDIIRYSHWLEEFKLFYELNGGYFRRVDGKKIVEMKASAGLRIASRNIYEAQGYLSNEHLTMFISKMRRLYKKSEQIYYVFDGAISPALYQTNKGYSDTPIKASVDKLSFTMDYMSYGKPHEISVKFIVNDERKEFYQIILDGEYVLNMSKDEFESMHDFVDNMNPMADTLMCRAMEVSLGSLKPYTVSRKDNDPEDDAIKLQNRLNEKAKIPEKTSFFGSTRISQSPGIDFSGMAESKINKFGKKIENKKTIRVRRNIL